MAYVAISLAPREPRTTPASFAAVPRCSSLRYSTSSALVHGPWNRQSELRDRSIETITIIGEHLVTAAHRADGGFQHRAGGVMEVFAGQQVRLFADDAVAAHFLHLAVGIGNDPVPRQQLCRNAAIIGDADRVG